MMNILQGETLQGEFSMKRFVALVSFQGNKFSLL